jgi:hypothetical protein
LVECSFSALIYIILKTLKTSAIAVIISSQIVIKLAITFFRGVLYYNHRQDTEQT